MALTIAVLLFSALVLGLGALTGTRARKALGELGGAARSLYDTASLTGHTCRMVLLLPKDDSAEFSYRAECANGSVTSSYDRDQELRDATTRAVEAAKKGPRRGRDALPGRPAHGRARRTRRVRSSSGSTLLDVLDGEKERVERAVSYSAFTSPEIEPRKMTGVRVSVWTAHQRGEGRQRAGLPLLLPPGLHRAGPGHRPPGPQRLDAADLPAHREDLHRRRRAGDPQVMNRRGFTLLEVVVALAILGLALLAIFDLNAGAVNSHAYAKRLTVATMLARSKMTDLEQELYDKGFDADDQERSGDFKSEGWEAFTWKAQILAPRTSQRLARQADRGAVQHPRRAERRHRRAGVALRRWPRRRGGRPRLVARAAGGVGALGSAAGGRRARSLPEQPRPAGLQALGPMGALAQTQMTQLLDQIQKGVREVHLTVSWKEGKRTESIDVVTDVVSLRPGLRPQRAHPERPSRRPAPPGCPESPSCRRASRAAFPRADSGRRVHRRRPTAGNTPPGAPLDPFGRPIATPR